MIDTWTCEICHEERPDQYISVLTYLLSDFPGAERNLKYCNDKESCHRACTIQNRKRKSTLEERQESYCRKKN